MSGEKYTPKEEASVVGSASPHMPDAYIIPLWVRHAEAIGHENIVEILEGGLNRNIVFRQKDFEQRLVLRVPKSEDDRTDTFNVIQYEYDGIGATEHGISFQLRSIDAQAAFVDETRKKGLKTLPHFGIQNGAMILPFIDGIALSKYVGQERDGIDFPIIENILQHMTTAHNLEVTFGDRWTVNTIISSDGNFTEIDFDIALIGRHKTVSTFEISQTLYHLVHFAGENRAWMVKQLSGFYRNNSDLLEMYDAKKLRAFMVGQAKYFHQKYELEGVSEELVPPYTEIYDLVDQLVPLQDEPLHEETILYKAN